MDRATNEKYDEEQHIENIVSPLRSQHVQASGAIFNEKDEKIKEARNVTFAAAVAISAISSALPHSRTRTHR